MPTEAAFLLAGLFFVAAALGYLFAKFGDSETGPDSDAPAVSADYLRGLNYLLSDDSDRALEVFSKIAEVDGDTLETQFALGTLFRRRGEIDRAIRVHQQLMARDGLPPPQRDQAAFALAEDYRSAGLLDRAESLFQELKSSPVLGMRAREGLMRLYEQTGDWPQAIEVHDEIERDDPEAPAVGHVAHYWCELAEQARAAGDIERARGHVVRADGAPRRTVRSLVVRAQLLVDEGRFAEAVQRYREAMDTAPWLMVSLAPALAAAARAAGDDQAFGDQLRMMLAAGGETAGAAALAVLVHDEIDDPAALDALDDLLRGDAALADLVDAERLGALEPGARREALRRVRAALRRLLVAGSAYRCGECGYTGGLREWQCPGCGAWESLRPLSRLPLPSPSA